MSEGYVQGSNILGTDKDLKLLDLIGVVRIFQRLCSHPYALRTCLWHVRIRSCRYDDGGCLQIAGETDTDERMVLEGE